MIKINFSPTGGGGGGTGTITSGTNVGLGTGTVFKNTTVPTLNFKTIVQGSGITITNNVDDITIASSGTETRQLLAITINGQTAFTLSAIPVSLSNTKVFVNGQKQLYAIDYTIVGTSLTWLNTNFTLRTTDILEVYF